MVVDSVARRAAAVRARFTRASRYSFVPGASESLEIDLLSSFIKQSGWFFSRDLGWTSTASRRATHRRTASPASTGTSRSPASRTASPSAAWPAGRTTAPPPSDPHRAIANRDDFIAHLQENFVQVLDEPLLFFLHR